jgi:hypothetical protein
MTIHDALCFYDHSQVNIARALGVAEMTICNWKKKKHIPFQWQCQLEVITKGALKASEKD